MNGDRFFSSSLRVSSRGIRVFTHYDIYDNVLCHTHGHRKVTLVSPEHAQVSGGCHCCVCHVVMSNILHRFQNMYLRGTQSAVVNMDTDEVDPSFHRFSSVPRMQVILEPGDCLYIPACW